MFNAKPIVIALLATSLVACGGSSYRSTRQGSSDLGGSGGGGSTGGTTAPGGTSTDTPDEGFMPSYSFAFNLTGTGGTQPTWTSGEINTDNILKIRINPGAAGNLSLPSGSAVPYSNFSATYGCVSYQITVNGRSVRTVTLSVNGTGTSWMCPQAPDSQVIDFSDRGPFFGPVKVQVTQARYDYYCQLLVMGYINPYYSGTYCSAQGYPVYKNHTVTGSIDVQVNGSSL
jgi:hypothetical protein